jgi:hypothetical protein
MHQQHQFNGGLTMVRHPLATAIVSALLAAVGCAALSPARVQAQVQARAAATGPAPLVLKTTLPLPDAKGRLDHLGVDVKGRRLFLAEIGNGGVEAIDLASGKSLHMLTGFGKPQGIYFDPGTNHLYVASGEDGTVKIFDGTTYAPVATPTIFAGIRARTASSSATAGKNSSAAKPWHPGASVASATAHWRSWTRQGRRARKFPWTRIQNRSSWRKPAARASS